MYHYIRDFKKTKYKNIKGLDVKEFLNQVKYLKSKFNIISPEEVKWTIKNNKNFKKNDCWLTFDDGYIDHYKYVLPILDKFKINGSFYPPVNTTLQKTILDVNKIHFILERVKDKENLINKIAFFYNNHKKKNWISFSKLLQSIKLKKRFDDRNTAIIKFLLQQYLPKNIKKKITNDLFKKYVSNSISKFSRKLYMNLDHLNELKHNGNEIGMHSYDHDRLKFMNYSQQKYEISRTINFWKKNKIIDNDFSFCYPYGSYDNNTLKILRKTNCIIGLTTKVSRVDLKKYKKFELPRFDTNDFPK